VRSRDVSKTLHKKALALFPGGVNSPVRAFKAVGGDPLYIQYGEGAFLYDADGNRYVDYVLSFGPHVLGHAHPEIIKALTEQQKKGVAFGANNELEIMLAEEIVKLMPSIEKLRFVNSGTEAGIAAVRVARAYTQRTKIIKFSGCYHGHGDSFLVKAGSGVATLSLPDSPGVLDATASETLTAQFNNKDSVEALFKQFPDTIAAVIVEPIVGNAGLIIPKNNFLQDLSQLTNRYGALLIFDEVMTGLRVDLGGAQALYGITPDLTMLGKVIGGGLPVGAYGGRKDIMDMIAPLGSVYQAGTLSGNPLAMAAGLVNIRYWKEACRLEKTALVAEELVAVVTTLGKEKGIPVYAKSVGTMFGFFFHPGPVDSYEDALNADSEKFKQFYNLALEEGIYFAPSQFEAGFVSYAHIGEPLAYTIEALKSIFNKL
jgi:glutamate-1-semialdehyde 2,1-aminomutase